MKNVYLAFLLFAVFACIYADVTIVFSRGQGCTTGVTPSITTCTNWTSGQTVADIVNNDEVYWVFNTTTNRNPTDTVICAGSMNALYKADDGTISGLWGHVSPAPSTGGDLFIGQGQVYDTGNFGVTPNGDYAAYSFTIVCDSGLCTYNSALLVVPSMVLAFVMALF